jgi:Protein of unknown function (DUF4245)
VLAASLPVLRRGGLAAHPVLRGGRWVLTCLLLAFVIIVAVPLPHASSPPAVSYQGDLAAMTRAARYPVLAPSGLPLSWSPVSSGVALGGANGAGTATWHLGYVTPSGALASMEESDAAAARFIRRMTNGGTAVAPVQVAGRAWRASTTPGRGQRSLYETDVAGATIVITGNASWDELRTLAASLRPVPPGS